MKSQRLSNLFLVFLLIATSGIPYFVGSEYLMPLAFLYCVILCLIRKVNIFDSKLFIILFFVIFIAFFREIVNGFEPSLYTIFVIFLKYSFPFFVLKLTRLRFPKYYNVVIYYLSIISLFFFVLFTISPQLETSFKSTIAPIFEMGSKSGFYEYAPNFILYTMNVKGRNHGPFWEAGGFGAFLIIAIIFHLIQKRSIFDKHGIIFLVSAATTFSTATYVALFFLVMSYILYISEVKYRLLLMAIIILGAYNIYTEADFLQKKVLTNLETVNEDYESRVANRFTSILIDLEKIYTHPVFGNPQNTKKEYTIYSHRNNGLSSMAVKYGLIYTIFFFTLLYLSFKRLSIIFNCYQNWKVVMFFLAMISIYFSQVLTDKPIFSLMAFWPFFLRSVRLRKRETNYKPIYNSAFVS